MNNESTTKTKNIIAFAETFNILIYNILYLCDKPGYTLDTTT